MRKSPQDKRRARNRARSRATVKMRILLKKNGVITSAHQGVRGALKALAARVSR